MQLCSFCALDHSNQAVDEPTGGTLERRGDNAHVTFFSNFDSGRTFFSTLPIHRRGESSFIFSTTKLRLSWVLFVPHEAGTRQTKPLESCCRSVWWVMLLMRARNGETLTKVVDSSVLGSVLWEPSEVKHEDNSLLCDHSSTSWVHPCTQIWRMIENTILTMFAKRMLWPRREEMRNG